MPTISAKLSPRGEKAPYKEQASRYIPKQIRREVRERDGNRCVYVDETTGKRCDCVIVIASAGFSTTTLCRLRGEVLPTRRRTCGSYAPRTTGWRRSCERPYRGMEGNTLDKKVGEY
jgi:hypothetical protein